ncbi:hypothetical protein K2X92_04475 [Candidatus Gracilibacteria bacterium]|nr:hypothetical protein [Candidatus Gracilibacteria bacterium]
MNLLQKFIALILVQLFGLFLSNPLFAISGENKIVVSNININDVCGKNIQCYEIGENQYKCEQTSAGINNLQGHFSNIQVGNNDQIVYHDIRSGFTVQQSNSLATNKLYRNPEGDIYPFVGIIKIQV